MYFTGSLNDAGIFQSSNLGRALAANEIDIPERTMLPNTNIQCPFYFIGDGGFPLKKYSLKPYVRTRMMSVEQRIFNIRLSHARKIIECAFGVLCKRWRIFECALDFNLRTSEIIIMSAICLHNFIITDELTLPDNVGMHYAGDQESSDSDSTDSGESDGNNSDSSDSCKSDDVNSSADDGDGFNTAHNISDNESDDNVSNSDLSNVSDAEDVNADAQQIRRILQSYFVSPFGNVHWQWQKLR